MDGKLPVMRGRKYPQIRHHSQASNSIYKTHKVDDYTHKRKNK